MKPGFNAWIRSAKWAVGEKISSIMSVAQTIIVTATCRDRQIMNKLSTGAPVIGRRQATYTEHRAHKTIAVPDGVQSAARKLANK